MSSPPPTTEGGDSLKVVRKALRLAVEAFAQYAEETNAPSVESVEGFEEGFLQQARFEVKRDAPSPTEMGIADAYTVGFVSLSACMPEEMPIEEAERQINAVHPTGIQNPWSVSDEPMFSGGESNPCPCERTPGRVHRLFYC